MSEAHGTVQKTTLRTERPPEGMWSAKPMVLHLEGAPIKVSHVWIDVIIEDVLALPPPAEVLMEIEDPALAEEITSVWAAFEHQLMKGILVEGTLSGRQWIPGDAFPGDEEAFERIGEPVDPMAGLDEDEASQAPIEDDFDDGFDDDVPPGFGFSEDMA